MTASTGGFAHRALLYSSTEQYLTAVTGFVRAALEAREPVGVAGPPTNVALLRRALRGDADRVRLWDMTKVGRNPGLIIPMVLHAFADAHPTDRVRVVSEPVWPGRSPDEIAACMRHEASVNTAFAGRRITIMCPFPETSLTNAGRTDVHSTHPSVVNIVDEQRGDDFEPEQSPIADDAPRSASRECSVLAFDLRTLVQTRQAAVAHARRAGLPDPRVYAVGLAVSELATNSIQHGGGGGILRIWTEGDNFICEISDSGRFDGPLVGRRPVPATQLSGRGLIMVETVTDLAEVRSDPDGTTVRFSMAIDSAHRSDGDRDAGFDA